MIKAESKLKLACLFVAISLLSLIGCSKNSIENAVEEHTDEIGFVIANVNGKSFKTPNEDLLLDNLGKFAGASINLLSNLYIITISAIDVQDGLGQPKNIGLVIIDTDFNTLEVGKVFNTVALNIATPGAGAWYLENSEFDTDETLFKEGLQEIVIKITALDRENKLISGEFSFERLEPETNTHYSITDGKFTNLPYKLKER